jgi:hypothetical protein
VVGQVAGRFGVGHAGHGVAQSDALVKAAAFGGARIGYAAMPARSARALLPPARARSSG